MVRIDPIELNQVIKKDLLGIASKTRRQILKKLPYRIKTKYFNRANRIRSEPSEGGIMSVRMYSMTKGFPMEHARPKVGGTPTFKIHIASIPWAEYRHHARKDRYVSEALSLGYEKMSDKFTDKWGLTRFQTPPMHKLVLAQNPAKIAGEISKNL